MCIGEYLLFFLLLTFINFFLQIVEGRGNKIAPSDKQQLISRETNPVNFVGLFLMRLFYGITKLFGWDVSEWFGGALVPPGAEDEDDYDDFDL